MHDGKMLRYDRLVAIRSFRAAVAGWRDWATLAILLGIGAALVRNWYTDAPPEAARIGALAAGMVSGFAVARGIEARLAFHAADSPFAHEALSPSPSRRHALAWHGAALIALLILAAAMGLTSIPFVLVGVAAGAVAGHASTRLPRPPRAASRARAGWRGRGLVAILVALAHGAGVAALRGSLSSDAALIAAAASAGLLLLLLSPVDDKVVRFMARSGRGPFESIVRHVRPLLFFAGADAPLMLFTLSPAAAGLVTTAAMLVLLLVAARVLVYRVYSRRPADLLLTVCGGCGGLLLTTAPVLLPPLLLVGLAYFYRRAGAVTWLYA